MAEAEDSAYSRRRGGAPLRQGSIAHVIAFQEVYRAWRDPLFLVGAAVAAFLASNPIFDLVNENAHTKADLVLALQSTLWAAVALTAVVVGPMLAEDRRRAALELYFTRNVGRVEYLVGKILAVFMLTLLTVLVTGLLYYVVTLVRFTEHPDGWALVPLGLLGMAVIWSIVLSGIGLSVSSLTRGSRPAILVYVGIFIGFGLIIPGLMTWATGEEALWILSPFMAALSQSTWLVGHDPEAGFPLWWGIVELVGLTVAGWGVFLWRRPRVRGEDDSVE